MNSCEAFAASCWLWKCFPRKEWPRCLQNWQGGWREVRGMGQMRQNSIRQFVPLLKCGLCEAPSGAVMEKNWALSGERCRTRASQFSAHLIDLLSTRLRCDGFTRTQKAGADQTGRRAPDGDRDLFLVQVWLREALWKLFAAQALSALSPVAI